MTPSRTPLLLLTLLTMGAAGTAEPACEPADPHSRALALYQQGETDRAAEILQDAVTRAPSDAWLHRLLGMVYRDGSPSRLEEAAAALQEALRLDPSVNDVAAAAAELLVLSGRLDDAEELLRRRLETRPDDVTARRQLGALVQSAGRFAEGTALLREAAQADPSDPLTWLELGRGLLRSGDPAAAATSLERARALDPDSPAVRFNLGQAYAMAGRDAEAAGETAEYDRLLAAARAEEQEARRRKRTLHSIVLQEERLASAAGRPAEEYADLSRLYAASGKTEDGRRFYAALAADRPADAGPWIGTAVLQGSAGLDAAAWEALREAHRRDPLGRAALALMMDRAATPERRAELGALLAEVEDQPGSPDAVPMWRGLLAMEEGDLEGAERAFERALARTPDDADLLLNLGALYGRTGRREQAIQTFHRIVEANPGDGIGWFNLALAESRAGRQADAVRHLERALAAGVEMPAVFNLLAQLLLQQGALDRAAELFARSLDAAPDQPEVRRLLERIRNADAAPGGP